MPESNSDKDTLKQVAMAAALFVGPLIVRYMWREGKIQGYAYVLPSTKNFLIGHYQHGMDRIVQFSGRLPLTPEQEPVIDQDDLPSEEVAHFKDVFLSGTEDT